MGLEFRVQGLGLRVKGLYRGVYHVLDSSEAVGNCLELLLEPEELWDFRLLGDATFCAKRLGNHGLNPKP